MIRLSKLALAAVLAASLPAAAAARDCDHGHGDDYPPADWAPPAAYPLPPPQPAARPWREVRWRERQLAALRAERRALEEERADFYARPGVRRGQARRFERYYAERLADLERRWHALRLVAMR
jgi:hypothetical protein